MKKTAALLAFLTVIPITCSARKLNVREFVTSTMSEPWAKGVTAPSGGTSDTLFVNCSKTEQTIDGFGVSFSELSARSLNLLSEKDRKKVLDELFVPGKGANLTINRCPIGANDFSYDFYSYDETKGDFLMKDFSISRDRELLLPLIKEAQKRNPDMKIWSVPWCPPTWMKRNHHYAMKPARVNDLPRSGRGREGEDMFIQDEKYFEAYALYFEEYIKAYREQGVDIFMVMPQNEMNSDQNFPSCCWTSAGLNRFLEKLCPRMKALGVEVFFGTCERPNAALVDTILTHPTVGPEIKGVGFQWRGKDALPVIRSKYPKLKYIQTEQECGNGLNDWTGATYRWQLFKHYLSNGVSIYDYWNLSLKARESSRWGWRQNSLVLVDPAEHTYRYTIEYYLLKHFSHYVLPGAKAITLPSDKDALAFRNPDGSIIVIAANFNKEAKDLTVSISGDKTTVTLKPESFSTLKITGHL